MPDPAKLLLTSKQETELGEIVRQQFESDFRVIEDPQVTAYLDRVGQRVARHLPDTGIHFEFFLYDRPEIQAFSMPGGRIYVSRKMIAFLKTEDELAGVLGHEMGHVAARQQALELSRVAALAPRARQILAPSARIRPNENLFETAFFSRPGHGHFLYAIRG